MGAFARSRLSEFLHGSHTRDLVDQSPVALCLQH
jgi:nucleotide-binding universal stress UspA family protein